MVGTSGRSRQRFLPVTASARSLPAFMCGTDGVVEHELDLAAEQVVQRRARALVGHVRHLDAGVGLEQLAHQVRQAARPVEPKLSVPGFAFASATSSATLFAGTEGCTTSTVWLSAISDTGARSLIGSKASFL